MRAASNFQMPGRSCAREIRPLPIAPTLMRFEGGGRAEDRGGHDRREAGQSRGGQRSRSRRGEEPAPRRMLRAARGARAGRRPPIPDRRPPVSLHDVTVTRWALACASSISSLARKQCACGIAVSVRLTTSSTSAARRAASTSWCRCSAFASDRPGTGGSLPVAAGDVHVLPHLDVAVGAEDRQAAVAPGGQAVGREPVDADVAGAAVAAQHDVAEVLELRLVGMRTLPTCADTTSAARRAGEVQELVGLVRGDVAEDAAVAAPCARTTPGALAGVMRCGPSPIVWITRPIAPAFTSSPALTVARFSNRSLYMIE